MLSFFVVAPTVWTMIVTVDRNGDTLAILIRTQNDELAGLGLFGNEGRLDLIESHSGSQCLFSYDSVHTPPSFLSASKKFRQAERYIV